jgi:hypothetical protein
LKFAIFRLNVSGSRQTQLEAPLGHYQLVPSWLASRELVSKWVVDDAKTHAVDY